MYKLLIKCPKKEIYKILMFFYDENYFLDFGDIINILYEDSLYEIGDECFNDKFIFLYKLVEDQKKKEIDFNTKKFDNILIRNSEFIYHYYLPYFEHSDPTKVFKKIESDEIKYFDSNKKIIMKLKKQQ